MLHTATARPMLGARRTTVQVACSAAAQKPAPVGPQSRRALLFAGAAGLAAAAAGASKAADFKDALAKKEARKAKLREAAGNIKATGKDQQVFKASEYSMPEEAHTPNIHTRQNEGARSQENA